MSCDDSWLTDRQFARIALHLPTDTPLLTSVVQSARSSCPRRMALTGCREGPCLWDRLSYWRVPRHSDYDFSAGWSRVAAGLG